MKLSEVAKERVAIVRSAGNLFLLAIKDDSATRTEKFRSRLVSAGLFDLWGGFLRSAFRAMSWSNFIFFIGRSGLLYTRRQLVVVLQRLLLCLREGERRRELGTANST